MLVTIGFVNGQEKDYEVYSGIREDKEFINFHYVTQLVMPNRRKVLNSVRVAKDKILFIETRLNKEIKEGDQDESED